MVEAAGREVRVTSPDKVFFPKLGATKLDLVRYYLAVEEPIMRAMGDRPDAHAALPLGRRRPVVLPEAGARQRPRLARDHDRQHGQRHDVAGPGGQGRRPPGLGGQPRLPRLPRVALPVRRPATTRASATSTSTASAATPPPRCPPTTGSTSCASTSTPSPAPASPRPWWRPASCGRCSPSTASPPTRRRPPAAASTSTCASSPLDVLRGAGGRGRRRPRARAPPARHPHRRLVEGGAGRAHLRRLQPERPPQDGVRRLVGPVPGRRAGVDAGVVGRAGRGPPRRPDHRRRCPTVSPRRRPVGDDGRRAPGPRRRCSPCPSATWPAG